MPMPNFHAARIKEPDLFRDDTYATTTIENSKGIELVSAKLKANDGKDEDPMTAQAYRFPKENYTAQQAKDWLKEHDITFISFEEASEEKAEKIAYLNIYGVIGEDSGGGLFDMFTENISAKSVREFLDDNKEATKIIVRINSRGGEVDEGFSIHDLLENSGKEIETQIEGKCYSIATVILLAGKKRTCFKNSDIIIHPPFIPPFSGALAGGGNAEELQQITDSLKHEQEKIENFYVKKTGSKIEDLKSFMDSEEKISPDKAKELGFITDIIEPLKAVAYINHKNNYQMNEIVNEVKGLKKVLAEFKAMFKAEGTEPVALKMKLKDGSEIDVDKMEVGGKCTKDGQLVADGSYEMEDGKTVVVSAGLITEIKEPETTDYKAEAEKLKAELETTKEEIEALKTSVAEKETVIENSKVENEELVKEFSEMKEAVAFIKKNIQSNYTPPAAKNQFKANDTKVKEPIDEWNEKRKQKKENK